MGKIQSLQLTRYHYGEDAVIGNNAKLIVADEGEGFRESTTFEINLDGDDEKIERIITEARAWTSRSRARLERAKALAARLGVQIDFVDI